MYLHAAAGLHPHEYSDRQHIPPRRSVFMTPARLSPIPDSPTNSSLIRLPGAFETNAPASYFQDHTDFSALTSQGVDYDTMSDGCQSYAPSEASGKTSRDGGKRRRTKIKSKSYILAHPAPLTIQQKVLRIRPKLLMQLQCISVGARPIPCLDVLASTRVVPRLSTRFPRLFKFRKALGPDDVMIFKSEDYNSRKYELYEDGEEDHLGHREALAVICHVKSVVGQAEVCLSNGSIWHATEILKGFEFETVDNVSGERTTARWVSRPGSKRDSAGSMPEDTFEEKYTFSVVQPGCRRHPILATLTRDLLDVQQRYKPISASDTPLGSPLGSPTVEVPITTDPDSRPGDREYILVEDALRAVIQVTSVWVALRRGWCANFRYNDNIQDASSSRPNAGSRKSSFNADPVPRSPTPEAAPSPSVQSSFGSRRGRAQLVSQIARNSASPSSPGRRLLSVSPQRRAINAGTTFLQRRASIRGQGANGEGDETPLGSPLRSPIPGIVEERSLSAVAIETYRAPMVTSVPSSPRRVVYDTMTGGKTHEAPKPKTKQLSTLPVHTGDVSRQRRGWRNGFGIFKMGGEKRRHSSIA